MQDDGPVMTFGLWLRRWRQAMDLSRPELARQVGCSRPMIRQIEADINLPSARLAVRLAAALGVPLDAQGRVVACARGQLSPAILPPPSLAVAMAAAPLPSSGHVPHPTTPLVGRDRELAALISQLTRRSTRLITLTGLTGVGKTHLARATAVTVQFMFGHGAWFVELAGAADPTVVARAIAHALGVADYGTRPIEAQVAIALAKRSTLLVLDGLEPAPPVTAIVKGLLGAAARLTVLTTSSRPLGLPGEAVVPVSPLATPRADPPLPLDELAGVPAVALFAERARAVAPGVALTEATAPAIAGISRRLGGLPLAIELAAARLQVLSPDELAASIERDVDAVLTLTSPSVGHRGLLAALEGAWASLPDSHRRMLDRLAIFPAPCGRAAAEAVAGATIDDLTSLITAGLLRQETGDRFVLHDLVRRIAARRLAQAGEDLTVARRHARHYLQLAEEAVPALPSVARDPWLVRLAAEQVHLQAALSWAIDHEPPLALRMVAALPWYWYFRGAFGQGRSWLERALAAAPGNDIPVRAHARAGAGALAWAQGDHAAARAWLESAVGDLRAQPEQRALVHALAILTLTAHDQGDHRAAVSWAREGTAAGRAQPDPWSLALALTAEGAARLGAGDLEGADMALAESLEIWAELQESWGLAMALLNRGRVAFAEDEYAAAATYLEDGLDRLQRARDRRFSAAALLLLGEIARRQGDLPLAQARFAASLIAYQETGTGWGVCLCLEGLAATAAAAGQPGQAARLLGAAAAVHAPGAASRPPDHATAVEHLAAGLQSALGEENFRAHWTAGHILTAEQAVAELAGLTAGTAS